YGPFVLCLAVRRLLFFFSSRRRHTRSKRDWSSDVCSSDLLTQKERLRKTSVSIVEWRLCPLHRMARICRPDTMDQGHIKGLNLLKIWISNTMQKNQHV